MKLWRRTARANEDGHGLVRSLERQVVGAAGTMLRFDPSAPTGKASHRARPAKGLRVLHVRGLRLAHARMALDVDTDPVTASNLRPGLELVRVPARR